MCVATVCPGSCTMMLNWNGSRCCLPLGQTPRAAARNFSEEKSRLMGGYASGLKMYVPKLRSRPTETA